jgi:hypothetical protein
MKEKEIWIKKETNRVARRGTIAINTDSWELWKLWELYGVRGLNRAWGGKGTEGAGRNWNCSRRKTLEMGDCDSERELHAQWRWREFFIQQGVEKACRSP